MATNPTVVVGSLNDEEIKKTIDSLVEHVNKGMEKIVSNTNSAVDGMKNKLRELGTFKVDSSGTADGGSTRRTKSMQMEQKSVQDLEMSYDKLLGALQYAQRQTTMYASKNPWSLSTEDLEKYEDAMRRVAEYEKQLASMQGNLALQRIQKSQFTPDMKEYTENLIRPSDELKKMSAYYRELEKSTERQAQAHRQVANEVQKVDGEIQKQIEDEKHHIELVKELASQVRGGMKYSGFSEYTLSGYRTDATVYAENDARAKGLTIEQQIENILKEEEKSFQAQASSTSKILDNEMGITQEQQKRKYVKPDTWQGIDVTRSRIEGVISSKTGQDAISWDEQTSSIKKLQSALKQYQDTYIRLSAEERNSPVGKQMIEDMRVLERVIQNARKEMSRPISLDTAMGGTPKTLDEIAYKMQQLTAYRNSLNFTDPKQKEEFDQITQKLKELGKERDKLIGGNDKWIKSNNAVARSLNYIKNRLAFYLTVGATMSFVKQIIETRAQYEMLERSLGILIDSAQRGTEIFREMQQMALISPFTTVELADAAKQLAAYDIAAKDVVDTIRRMGDIAAAVGIPIERMTYALGQIKSYGYMTSINTRMFTRAGIPVVQGLADYYTQLEGRLVSMGDVLDRIKKRAVSYNDVMAVMQSMTDEGGKFFDYQAKMAETLKIQLANLNLAWQNMLNEIGKSNQTLLSTPIKVLKDLFLQWKQLDNVIWSCIGALSAYVIAQRIAEAATGKHTMTMILQALAGKNLTAYFKNLSSTISTSVAAINPYVAAITAVVAVGVGVYNTYSAAAEAIREYNKAMRDGAKENVERLDKFMNSSGVSNPNFNAQNLSAMEANKLWEEMRNEIELTTTSAEKYVGVLLQEEDVQERIAKGTQVLRDIRDVESKMQGMADDAINITQEYSAWWNLWNGSDGLTQNIKDYTEELQNGVSQIDKIKEAFQAGGLASAIGGLFAPLAGIGAAAYSYFWSPDNEERLKQDIHKFVDSIINEANRLQMNNSQSQYFFQKQLDSYISRSSLEDKEAIIMRTKAWEDYIRTRQETFDEQIKKESDAYTGKESEYFHIEELKKQSREFREQAKENNVLFDEFAKVAVRNYKSQFEQMFGGLTQAQLENFDFTGKQWTKLVDNAKEYFEKNYNISLDNLENLIKDPKRWLLIIQTSIQGAGQKSIFDELTKADQDLEDAQKKIDRLKKSIKENAVDRTAATLELQQAQADWQDAYNRGGRLKDKKSGSKKDVLGDALSKEIQLINNVQSRFKDYQKMGIGANEAIARATEDYGAALDVINRNLAKFGMRTLSASEFANMDLRNVRDLMRAQLDLAKRLGNEKGVQALSDAITNINKEIASIDYKRITDGLNNELSKLKDEYELAVELDANPELGDMFMDMFNLDSSDFPKTIDEYMQRVQQVFDKTSKEMNYDAASLDVFTATKDDWEEWGRSLGLSEEVLKSFSSKFIDAQGVVKKWAQDIVKQTQDLQYKLADTNGKIAIEEEKLQRLKQQYAEETNEQQRRLLDLQIRDQENAIAKLKEEALQLLPTYVNLFNSIVEHSARVTRRIAQQWKDALKNAVKNADGTYTITDPNSGAKATITEKQYGKELDKVNAKLRETQGSFAKIREAFTKGEDDIVDYTKGLELVAQEAKKAADGIHTIADIVGYLGGEDADDAVETLNDIATTIEGVATATEGIAQIQNGDVIGGAVNVLKGTWQAVSTWLDNSDKKITRQVKDSERSIKGLELAYKDLQNAMEDAYGYEEVAIKRATIANKQLQLAELERQLALEKSRKKKNRDKDRIMDLEGEIADLRNEIKNSTKEIVNDLLGISSVGDAAEQAVASMIEAYKNGEDYMKVFEESFEDMIDNMIVKAIAGRVIGDKIQAMFDAVKKATTDRADNTLYGNSGMTYAEAIQKQESTIAWFKKYGDIAQADAAQKVLNQMLKEYEDIARTTPTDLARAKANVQSWRDEVNRDFLSYMDLYGIKPETTDKQLSALQQGIQGITEDTAGALEAYMNGVSQQVYLHSQLLTDIRDAVQAINGDIMLDTQAQMLLQLQQSYAVQVAIQTMLAGWSSADGRSMRVEMM